ncbi:MAG: signal recognition particle-docking protein FtsY, partial [Bdellovibrionales bacterium]|nr:signal recognition particle-docking protein FtsY [Bdellovibrionales bacterium]
ALPIFSKTREGLWGRLQGLWSQKTLDFVEVREQFEEVLYTADIGPRTTERLLQRMDRDWKGYQAGGVDAFRLGLKSEMLSILGEGSRRDLDFVERGKLKIWLVVGINGAGKTTTIGKMSHKLAAGGHRVLVAAGDTFRAAAGSQLKTWTERAQVDIFEGNGSPSGVAFDAVQKALAGGYTALIIDTAGRLHTNKPLMDELSKTKRVIEKAAGRVPDETLIVLDANAGQNALMQAKQFHEAIGATAIIVTKLDGTAKGGIILGIVNELKLPITLLGIGEKIDDLVPFEVEKFVASVVGN